jgi:hypothetical protein
VSVRLLAVPLIAACVPEQSGRVSLGRPHLVAATLERAAPNVAPLVWKVTIEADEPVEVEVEWTDGDRAVTVALDGLERVHDADLVGFRAGGTYEVTATLRDADGHALRIELGSIVARVPEYFPHAEVLAQDPGAVSGDHTVVLLHTELAAAEFRDILAEYDEEGHLVHWLQGRAALRTLAEPTAESLLGLVLVDELEVAAELSWSGTVEEWWTLGPPEATGVAVEVKEADRFHHDVVALPGGDLVALTQVPLHVEAYPVDYVDEDATAPAVVNDDVVVRFARDGRVVSSTALSTLLPVERIGFDSLDVTATGGLDWAHANAVVQDPHDGGFVVSLRNQDALVKFLVDPDGRATLQWILGNAENWPAAWQPYLLAPIGPVEWPYHQHGPRILRSDAESTTLVVFDNGAHRAVPFSSEPPGQEYSRVVQYTIDHAEGTVWQAWSSAPPLVGLVLSAVAGNAAVLPNGNVLGTFGHVTAVDGVPNKTRGIGDKAVWVVEFDPTTSREVWHLSLTTDTVQNAQGWFAYRAFRMAFPPGRVVE